VPSHPGRDHLHVRSITLQIEKKGLLKKEKGDLEKKKFKGEDYWSLEEVPVASAKGLQQN